MPQTQTADDSLSLRDHEATFPGKDARRRPEPDPEAGTEPSSSSRRPGLDQAAKDAADEDLANSQDPMRRFRTEPEGAKPRERHRAKGDRAKPEDVPEIQTLTAQLKAKEDELKALKPTADSEAPRVVNLRRQIRGLEAEIADARPRPAATTTAPPDEKPPTWDRKEPQFDDFKKDPAKYPDPYAAWLRASAVYDAEKLQFERDEKNGVTAKAKAAQEAARLVQTQFAQRRDTFKAAHPDYETKWKAAIAGGYEIPPVVTRVVLTDDNGPALVYSLLHSPAEMDRLMTLYEDKPVTAGLTARVRRELLAFHQRQAAGSTGAAPAQARTRTFTPPTPVRTTPIQTGEEPPDEGSSLAEHERFYSRDKRRRS